MSIWRKPALAGLLAAGLLPAAAQAVPATDVVEAPTGFFVPTDAQKYDFPYYRGAGQDWSWQHGAVATPFTTAELSISAFDVDSDFGEKDDIFVMDSGVWTYVGTLTGTDNAWDYGNSFTLGANFFDDIVAGLMVEIRIDQNNQGWIVTLGKSVLSLDQGVRPPPTPGGVVPEPATWAMLITGFGFVGAMARRRRQSMAVSA
jgi:hypothetical protein